MRTIVLSIVGACALGLAGCGNHFTPSPKMADAPAAIAASPDAATLVFVRPSLYAGVMNPSVFVDGKFAGDVEGGRQVVAIVPPGPHVLLGGIHDFMTKACRQAVINAEAGKLYYIETTVAMGADLFVVHTSDAPKLKEWLARAPGVRRVADPTSPMDAKEQSECAKFAQQHLDEDSPEDRAKHTITPADGFASPP